MKTVFPIVLLVCGTVSGADESAISLKDVPRWGWAASDYKVKPFIATAALLQALGKDKAIVLLKDLSDHKRIFDGHEARLRATGLKGHALLEAVFKASEEEREHQEGLIILCRMLFTAKQNAEFRRPLLGRPHCVGRTPYKDWQLEPIEIVDGVPFLIVKGYTLAGVAESPQAYLEYCLENCTWSTAHFKPKVPEEQEKALKTLMASPKLKGMSDDDRTFLVSQIERPDLLIADFEGDAYPAGWKTTGDAFGKGPAKGTLPNQMPVSGFLGKGLVNSYLGGDGSTGTLTSPAFKVERKHLNFLVGGGKHPKTSVNLLIDGKAVRTATGSNDKAGGSEHLDWHTWDVAEFEGKDAAIEIVDGETGGWGHINADHFVQSDRKKQAEPVRREFAVTKNFLHLPVKNGEPQRRVKFLVGGQTVREFDIELDTTGKPDFWAFANVRAFLDKTLVVETTLPADSRALAALKASDDFPDSYLLYREKHRPLFHFTSMVGWLNDPNGLVYHDGEWHLYYQHNPYGREWGNMHWGHAVSKDLVRWIEEGIALYPKKYGDWAFSGSAVVDKDNTSGWGTKDKPPLVLAYTSTGRGECMAFSNDNGRTWTEYDKNPVVKHAGRDPKLVWYEKGKHWVMAVYDEHDKKQWIAFYTSPDLKDWKFASRIEGFYECPDLFEILVRDVTGNLTEQSKWVLYGADGKYLLGEFDGKAFKPDFKEKRQLWYGNFYAAQTFDNTPNTVAGKPVDGPGRRFQIGWARGVTFPGMPFNQQMTAPVELFLRTYAEGEAPRLSAHPVFGYRSLREREQPFAVPESAPQTVGERLTLADNLDAFDVDITFDIQKTRGFTLDLRGTKLVYDAARQTLTCNGVTAPVRPWKGLIALRILVDRGSVEVFQGEMAMSVAAIPDEKNRTLDLIPNGTLRITRGNVYRMKSAWEK